VAVPKTVRAAGADGGKAALHGLWLRRQSTKFNGCPYIVQRAAQAVHTAEGKKETRELVAGYMANAGSIRRAFEALGLSVFGGLDAPYVWVKLPQGMDSWKFFDKLLNKANIVGTPGAGFGPSGEGYFRLTGFGNQADTREAAERLKKFTA
jgi:LL-diaminopimelate aminotransferase